MKPMCGHHLHTNMRNHNYVKWSNDDVESVESYFKNRIETYTFKNKNIDNLNPENFLTATEDKVIRMLTNIVEKHVNIKFICILHCKYTLMKEEKNEAKVYFFYIKQKRSY